MCPSPTRHPARPKGSLETRVARCPPSTADPSCSCLAPQMATFVCGLSNPGAASASTSLTTAPFTAQCGALTAITSSAADTTRWCAFGCKTTRHRSDSSLDMIRPSLPSRGTLTECTSFRRLMRRTSRSGCGPSSPVSVCASSRATPTTSARSSARPTARS